MFSFFSLLSFFLLISHAVSHTIINISNEGQKTCTVTPLGASKNDVPQIRKAFEECNNGGKIIFPAKSTYRIAEKIKVNIQDVEIDWSGVWLVRLFLPCTRFGDIMSIDMADFYVIHQMTPDLNYWRKNSFPVTFQNHAAGIIFAGSNITINGHGVGGVHGNGEAWYNDEKETTKPGRPMPFVLWNVTDVVVRGFSVWQPPLWGFNIMNGTNISITNLYVNATARQAPWGSNWVQNTDGFDTMDVTNLTLSGLIYQGGDDCVAIKPRSHSITISNVTCVGGNGIAIGSLGQYEEDSSVTDVSVRNVRVKRWNEDLHNSAYIKTWIGNPVMQEDYESAGRPRGGGWGIVRNITLSDFEVEGADSGPAITQDSGNSDGSAGGTSKMEISNIVFENFRGYLSEKAKKRNVVASVSCSKVNPCHDIVFKGIKLKFGKEVVKSEVEGKCGNVARGGVKGLSGGGCE
jgi:galacturan 1,4-alpha-galacturonidase